MKDLWSDIARRAREAGPRQDEMPFGFDAAVLRRLERTTKENAIDAWLPVLRPALGLAFATALTCLFLQLRARNELPPNLLVETENLIQIAVLK